MRGGRANMKGGRVITIRVNPEDIMGCIDLVKKADSNMPGMSTAMIVRLALSGLLESARRAGVVPRRDGFEFEQMIAPFDRQGHGRKMNITDVVEQHEADSRSMDYTPVHINKMTHALDTPVMSAKRLRSDGMTEEEFDAMLMKKGRIMIRVQELRFKSTADPDNFDQTDSRELTSLESEIDIIDQKMEG